MTREKALEILEHNWTGISNPDYTEKELCEVLDIAIQILKATQSVSEKCKGCVEFTECGDLLNMLLGHSCEDCINREALLNSIEEPMNWTDSEAEIQEQKDYENFVALVKSMPSVTPKTGWIPVTEELPEAGYSVLVTRITNNGDVYKKIASYQEECWMDDTDKYGEPNSDTVIAWMPLPQTYTESEDEE